MIIIKNLTLNSYPSQIKQGPMSDTNGKSQKQSLLAIVQSGLSCCRVKLLWARLLHCSLLYLPWAGTNLCQGENRWTETDLLQRSMGISQRVNHPPEPEAKDMLSGQILGWSRHPRIHRRPGWTTWLWTEGSSSYQDWEWEDWSGTEGWSSFQETHSSGWLRATWVDRRRVTRVGSQRQVGNKLGCQWEIRQVRNTGKSRISVEEQSGSQTGLYTMNDMNDYWQWSAAVTDLGEWCEWQGEVAGSHRHSGMVSEEDKCGFGSMHERNQ